MKRLVILSLGLLLFTQANAGNPLSKWLSPYTSKRQKVQLAAEKRIAKGAAFQVVDSAYKYTDAGGGTWQPTRREYYTYDAAKNLTQVVEQVFDGTAWIDVNRTTYTWNTQNKLTRTVTELNSGGWSARSASTYRYTSRGDKFVTKMEMYDPILQTWQVMYGDSSVITYGANNLASRVDLYYYNDTTSTFDRQYRLDSLVYNSQNQPTKLRLSIPFGPVMIPAARISNIMWALGFNGISSILGGNDEININEFYFYENKPLISSDPTNYLLEESAGLGTFEPSERYTQTLTGGNLTEILGESWNGTSWDPSDKTNYTWDATGRMINYTYKYHDGTTFVDQDRTTWSYDPKSWVASIFSESYDPSSSTWTTNENTAYNRKFNVNNDITDVVIDNTIMTDSIHLFRNNSTGFNNNKAINISIYPNPVQDVVVINSNVEFSNIAIIDINGRIVSQTQNKNNALRFEVSLSQLPAGVYTLVATTKEGDIKQKLVKE